MGTWEKISKRLMALLKKIALNVILTEETKKKAVAKMNEKMDLPFLSEAQEKELLEIMWDSAEQAIRDSLSD